ncbi:MAG: isocitrate lyase/phosphoenolpyruvate mutase family protein [Actinomycetota bacterium]
MTTEPRADDPGAAFRALHVPGSPFILANAWDAGSAKMLAALGATAIGTSSAAHAFTLGRPDGGLVSRDEALAHAAELVAATPLPVSGDFENGFGDSPETVAETVGLSATAGLAGISIEDTVLPSGEPYPFEAAVDRIRAGVAAARALPADFVLLARADGVMLGNYDVDEAIRRIQAYEEVGADAVYVPLPPDLEQLARVVAAVSVPVNALAAGPFTEIPYQRFADIGVARISLGSALARATHRVINDAAVAMFDHGDFSLLGKGISGGRVDAMLSVDDE